MITKHFVIISMIFIHFIISRRVVARSPRIVGGYPVYIEQIPYMVNLRLNGSLHCGGSLITPKCILTAAHCVYNKQIKDFRVRAGVTFLTEDRNRRSIKNSFISPNYNSTTLDHDVAVLELNKPLHGYHIQTVAVSDESPQDGALVQVSGWGLVSENGYVSTQLRSVYVQVLSQQKCRALYRGYRNITDTMFCASIPGVKDACLADSGGPAVVDNRVLGIVSWGRGRECARSKSPGVYVNIQRVKPWLEDVMLKNCY